MKTKKLFSIIIAAALCFLTMLTVNAATTITLESGSSCPSTVYVGDTFTLKVSGITCKFLSNNKSVATITATTGKFTAVSPGVVTISAKSTKTGKLIDEINITILKRATDLTVSPQLVALDAAGDTAAITASLTPADSTDIISFSSNNTNIATVDSSSGLVTGVSKGITTVNVYAKENEETANSSSENFVKVVMVSVDSQCLCGDVNGNEAVNVEDVSAVQKHMAGVESIIGDYLVLGDVNGDGRLNISDATFLQRYAANFENCGNSGKTYGTTE